MCEHASRLAHLRMHTRAAHKSIETAPALARLMASDLRRTEYESALIAMHAFHAAIEPEIALALEGLPHAQSLLDGKRLRALSDDLAFLAAAPSQSRPDPIALPGTSQALGALYVIEGASLGGRVIARHIAESLALAPGAGASFYGGLSADAARLRWAKLCEVLDDATIEIGLDDLAQGACKTFECLERWMRRAAVAEAPHTLAVVAAA
jgi:heme oxygenase